jgi:hypothetical protein
MTETELLDPKFLAELYDELIPKAKVSRSKPNLAGTVLEHPSNKQMSEAERYAQLCMHNRALRRALKDEQERATQAEVAKQRMLDLAWEHSRQTQDDLDELYARTCHRGPGACPGTTWFLTQVIEAKGCRSLKRCLIIRWCLCHRRQEVFAGGSSEPDALDQERSKWRPISAAKISNPTKTDMRMTFTT